MARSQGVNHELSEVLNQLWSRDTNRLKPGTDYTISLQGKAGYVAQGSNTARDMARAPLFAYVNEGKLKNIKTYALFMRLLDNYEMSTGVSETVTSEELMENDLFLNAILETEVMKCAHKYLVSKGRSPSDQQQFKRQLYDMWFRLYHRDRSGGEDSCGFEHVFVGESKYGKEITGFHNWVQFYLQEKHGNVDYKGYKAQGNRNTPDEDDHVLNLQFSWKGLVKPVGSSFIGVSPEFEVALFTILFLTSTDKVTTAVVKVDEYLLEVVVYRQGRSIGTSYPKLLSSNNRDL
ncbi:uridylate-specific endoribonuclease C isoform X1 [Salmo salar]|uniref:Uridylate-specific endoribonuclease n=1 Tax=Salmo salar TaxID=8030 RepID=A0A1S3M0U2_SALSA|nr:uridylate-specific endoribonuclease C-like isoform X1 [Salmo salar]|eukprot:XP_013996735.1 PREDICTED: poly(U)-specific endoribonuclease-C-like isoform X1 [Salmo salar]